MAEKKAEKKGKAERPEKAEAGKEKAKPEKKAGKPEKEEKKERPASGRAEEKEAKPGKTAEKKPKKAGKAKKAGREEKPSASKAEVEEAIVNFANAGNTPSQIGMLLRDNYNVRNVHKLLGKRVEDVLREKKLLSDIPYDLLSLIRRSVKQERHMKENRKDQTAKRGYMLTVSKIRRLVRYYHQTGRLPREWRYTPEIARLLVK